MLKIIRQTIKQYNMLAPGDKVLVGLSGGVDSVVLLSTLMSLQEELGISVCAAHINHNLRRTAKQDEEFARHFCKDLDVPIHVFSADVGGLATREKLSVEEAGRKLRYQYLHKGLKIFDATKIAMGHHADDNAETVLLNLFRGAGLRGLCGILPVNGPVIRPLLEVSRIDIETYAHANGIYFTTDETNAESDYSRNYIRNKLLPVIRKHFGNGVSTVIAKNALGMRADEEFLSAAANKAFDALPGTYPAFKVKPLLFNLSEISIPINELLTHPPALSGRIIRHAIARLRGEQALKDIHAAHIQSIMDISQGRTGREVSLPGFIAMREYANLVLRKNEKNPETGYNYYLLPEIPVRMKCLCVTLTLQQPQKKRFHCTQAFNYDKVDNVLELRTRRPGDKIALAGTGTKKLQDYFTDTKTPKSRRDQIPLLADGSNILWIIDRYNRTNVTYAPINGQKTCWLTVEKDGITNECK